MSYHTFIYLSTQLENKKKIQLNYDHSFISFEINDKEGWVISSPVSDEPQLVNDFTVVGNYYWEKEGSYLKKEIGDKPLVLFVKEFENIDRYALFRQFMKNYLEEVKKWKIAFQGIDRN